MAYEKLKGGVAVITGGGGGLGEGLARAAAKAGMTVVITDIVAERLEEVASSIRADGGDIHTHVTDVADPDSVDALAKTVHSKFGGVRMLINNAAVEALGRIWEMPHSVWQRTLSINLIGVGNGLRSFVPDMIERGEPAWIANVSSTGHLAPLPDHGVYTASKAGILTATEVLRADLAPLNVPITVCAVLPGGIRSRIMEDAQASEDAAGPGGTRDILRQYIPLLMSGEEAGQIIFDGIVKGGFWISNDPERVREMTLVRAKQYAELLDPPLDFGIPESETPT